MTRRRRRSYRDGLYHALVDNAKRQILREALAHHKGNRTHTAQELGIQRTFLLRLIRQLRVTDDRQ